MSSPTGCKLVIPSIFDILGCVRDICPMASNNVNTMAAAAIAGHNLGFSDVQCTLLSDPE